MAQMTQVENIRQKAYMILYNFAFLYENKNLIVVNLKNIKQKAVFVIIENLIFFKESNMSEVNIYKSIAIVEINKQVLIDGYNLQLRQ